MQQPPTALRRWALVLMSASGCAALGYQIVWTQQSALWLGHETAAVLAVVAAFFGGLTVGALAFGPRIDRSRHPGRWYAACEAIIGLWSLALAFLMTPASRVLLDVIGVQPSPLWHWSIAFGGTFVLLLPATAAMGATLPAMERILATLREQGTQIGALYAANTFGAVLGVLGAAFVSVPLLGLRMTAYACAALNLLCAAAAFKVVTRPAADVAHTKPTDAAGHLGVLAATGLLGIGYEVVVVRVLSQVAENTVYTFSILLAVYLIGTTLGAAAYSRWLSNLAAPDRLRDRLLQLLSAACLLGIVSLVFADSMKSQLLDVLGGGMIAALTAEAALAAVAFLPATFMMGATFSHLSAGARAAGISLGRALGVNTLGAALAPLVFGVVLLPSLGAKLALALVAGSYLLLSSRRAWLAPMHIATASVALALVIWAPSLALVSVPQGGRLVSHVEGASATVSVVEDAHGVATLHINNRQQEGSSVTLLADARQALLPILLHPAPERALFLGLGTGVTARSASEDAELQVDAVELLPEVVAASAHFTHMFAAEPPSRLRVLGADARRFVRAAGERYDVIVADNFHPARSGSGALYTTEHFAAVRDRLAPGGLFCQWLPLHQLDLDTLRSIVRSFLGVYPESWAMLATDSLDTPVVGLVARRDGERFELEALRRRLAGARLTHPPAEFGIDSDLALIGSFIADSRSLASFVGGAALNTDDHPVVIYNAPRITYAPDSRPRDRLIALLREVDVAPEDLLAGASDAQWNRRLSAYLAARERFIEAGRDVRLTADVQRMLAQVREPLLSVLRISPDFRPAYDPLLQMAIRLAEVDTVAARALLTELAQVQPARPEAREALRSLSGET
jgi:spermidine synthase